jgi:hypothetical protein
VTPPNFDRERLVEVLERKIREGMIGKVNGEKE